MNEVYAEILERILDIFQDVSDRNVTDEELDALIPVQFRQPMMREMRKAFPKYRISGDFSRLRTIGDAVALVASASSERKAMLARFQNFIFEFMARKKDVSPKRYSLKEEIFASLMPQDSDNGEERHRKQQIYDYCWMGLLMSLQREFKFYPHFSQIEKAKTIEGLIEVFYPQGKF